MQKSKKVYEIFERISPYYDSANNRISLGMQKKWKKLITDDISLRINEKSQILDICCGTGDIGIDIAKKRNDIKITGLDFSSSMIEIAKKKSENMKNISFVIGDAKNLPYENDKFSATVISFGLRNTDDYYQVISEMARVTKKDGYIYILDSFIVQNKLILPFYTFFFRFVMPLLGGGIKRYKDYTWLYESTKNFVRIKDILNMYKAVGIKDISIKKMLFGASVIIRGQKY